MKQAISQDFDLPTVDDEINFICRELVNKNQTKATTVITPLVTISNMLP